MSAQNPASAPQGTVTPWLNVREAAARARTSPKRIYNAVAARQLKAVRLGSRLLFRAEWVDAFLERCATTTDV